ncbi:MAG: hypothetical protein DWQ34_19355 [Planctomycetota bacterium]|nr:MAG: hypothetical protein DWQ29_12135 [Planctomycetota bacterium]REJ89679.1 MAG: hypothetical protein DWQ34_19355 [Planctomycetota bacterium]REK24390.1 MAG: hypothetical protein DWQ41_15325 [Planctomycetota bacterium]REK38581.1 MAG: hypothetical protein DWQ45_04120 [Planctomycetota bacterium]
MPVLNALENSTQGFDEPYQHWLVEGALSEEMIAEIAATPIPDGLRAYDGTRAADNGGGGKDGKLRCYIERSNVGEFPALGGLIEELMSPETSGKIGGMIGRDLTDAYLRVEVIADREGFWLKPHKDIKEKLMTLLIYVNVCGESETLGTDIYDGKLNRVKTIPYRNNVGYFFAPGENTWHGFEKKEIQTERRSILINYVTFPTDWKLPSRRAA